ncbi:MAG TPA: cytidylate kinase-like family protein [Gemmataceae bacterium]
MNDAFANDDLRDAGAETPSPRHGFRGEPPQAAPIPAGLTVAVSREAGARGGSLGRRVARMLGWDVYGQELLEYIARDPTSRQDVLQRLSPDAGAWVEDRLQQLISSQELSQNPTILHLARVILALGAKGQVVLIGRGAGYILPREATLHVRIVAPMPDRIAYLGQWLRLTVEEAAVQVRLRDTRRQEFLSTHFHQRSADACLYDLVLNSTSLGEGLCADLILQAVRAKHAAVTSSDPDTV